jgi:hypothetical protein
VNILPPGPVVGLCVAVLEYWRQLGHTASCAADLRRYARAIEGASGEAGGWLVGAMRGVWEAEAPPQVELDSMRRQVSNINQSQSNSPLSVQVPVQ